MKFLIHACPQRMWYVEDFLIPMLREQGAEIVIMASHWGKEGYYYPITDQERYAHEAIDAGVDIVFGHHAHVLQKMEEYQTS